MAKEKPEPLVPKSEKRGCGAGRRSPAWFYGFMDVKLYTKWALPDADGSGFGSKKLSFFTGVCPNLAQARWETAYLA